MKNIVIITSNAIRHNYFKLMFAQNENTLNILKELNVDDACIFDNKIQCDNFSNLELSRIDCNNFIDL